MTIIKKTYDPSLHIMAKQLSTLILNTKKKLCKLLIVKIYLPSMKITKDRQKDSKSKIDLLLCADKKHLH